MQNTITYQYETDIAKKACLIILNLNDMYGDGTNT